MPNLTKRPCNQADTGQLPVSFRRQEGVTLIEVLVSISLFAVVAIGIFQSAAYSLRHQKNTEIANLATNLAVTKIEDLAGQDASTLTSTNNSTETGIALTGHSITFNRTTAITVNSDGSRTVTVTVSSPSGQLISPVSYSTSFAPPES